MSTMNAAPTISRLVLVGEPRADERETKIRRFRLARVKLEEESRAERDVRHSHLRRSYD